MSSVANCSIFCSGVRVCVCVKSFYCVVNMYCSGRGCVHPQTQSLCVVIIFAEVEFCQVQLYKSFVFGFALLES